jgi:hypothetical protein
MDRTGAASESFHKQAAGPWRKVSAASRFNGRPSRCRMTRKELSEPMRMATLNDADRSAFNALIAKHDRTEAEFELNEALLRRAADGRLEGYLWVIHVPTRNRLLYDLQRYPGGWLDGLDRDLTDGAFPSQCLPAASP